MSAGRRSWRSEKKRDGRKSRRRSIAILSGVLLALFAILLIPTLLPKEPPVRFVSIVPNRYTLDSSGLPVLPNSAVAFNAKAFEQVFRKLHEINGRRVTEPATVATPDDLKALVVKGEKLVLYCGLEAAVDKNAAVVLLLPGVGAPRKDLAEFITQLDGLKASQILLLLDLAGRPAGLANGRLGDDVVPLIEAIVKDQQVSGLSVICSCDAGQRSWEFPAHELTQLADSATDNSTDAVADESQAAKFRDPVIFSGTVFAHFVRNAFLKGKEGSDGAARSAQDLFNYLEKMVGPAVARHYGETQTVRIFSADATAVQHELLAHAEWPSEQDFVPSEQKSPAAIDDPDTDSKKSSQTADQSPELKDTPEAKFARLIADQQELANAGDALAATPQEWMDLNAALVSAQLAMLHGDHDVYAQMHDLAQSTIREIKAKLKVATTSTDELDFSPWLTVAVSEPKADAEVAGLFQKTRDDFGALENQDLLPLPLRERGAARNAFVDALVQDLRDLSDVISASSAPDQQKLMQMRARLIRRLAEPQRGWPKTAWPEEFFTIDEVLSGDDAAWHVTALKPLNKLVELRRKTLLTATGLLNNGNRLRTHVWQQVTGRTLELLTQLTAAERWLTIGPFGLEMARRTLASAESTSAALTSEVQHAQQLAAIRDAQRTEIPLLIQFLAQQQEEVFVTPGVLDSATMLAADILAGKEDVRNRFPDALLAPTEMVLEHVDAMFDLTRPLSANAPVRMQDLQHKDLLEAYVNRRVVNARSVSERWRLLALPSFDSTRVDLVQKLTMPGSDTQSGGRRTGLWLSFWSVRMLEAVSGQPQPKLWGQWQALVEALRTETGDEMSNDHENTSARADEGRQSSVVMARARLADSLRQQWSRQHTALGDGNNQPVFIAGSDTKKLIATDLKQRYDASQRNSEFYARVYQQLTGNLPASRVDHAVADRELTLNDDNRFEIDVSPESGAFVYILQANFSLVNLNPYSMENWFQLKREQIGKLLTLESSKALTKPVDVIVAIANDKDVVLDTRRIIVHPNNNTQWDVEFLKDGQPLTLRGDELKLPPTTQDAPVALTVRLVQHRGEAQSIRLQCFTANGDAFWDKPQALAVDKATQSVEVPLRPLTTADTPAPTAVTAPVTWNVLDGIRFEITPELFEATPQSREVFPVLSLATQYVSVADPKYDENRLELTIRVTPDKRGDALRPQKLPVEVHLNPLLQSLLSGEGTPPREENLADEREFRFRFREEIVQAINRSGRDNALEFGLSVAGIPQAWRWQLTENGPVPLTDEMPEVRVELNLANEKEVIPYQKRPFLMLANTWDNALLNVEAHIHGGQFRRRTAQWELQLEVENADDPGQRKRVLDEPIKLQNPRDESITVTAGQQNAWIFSTRTLLYGRQNLPIKGYKSGRYEIIASLKSIEGDAPPIEDRTRFILDSTEPNIRLSVPNRVAARSGQLSGAVAASDPESGIRTIRAGLVEDKLIDVESNGSFSLKTANGFPTIPEAEAAIAVPGTVFVEVTNGAGLVAKLKQPIAFVGEAMKKVQPQATATVLFKWSSKTEYSVTLQGLDGDQHTDSKTGPSPAKFEGVPPGSYKIEWKWSLGSKSKVVSVKAGANTFGP